MLKKIRLALYDKSDYMKNFMQYLYRQKYHALETRLFTSFENLLCQAKKGEIDVLLGGEEAEEEFTVLHSLIPQIILLSEGNMVREDSAFCKIFKYQSVPDIMREVLAVVADDDSIVYTEKRATHKSAEILAVYAPFGGSGVSQYAFSMAKDLSGKFRTLYVNLEAFYGFCEIVTDKKGKPVEDFRGMSEVIFYIRQKKEKLALKLESIIVTEQKLDCLLTVEDYRDLFYMTKEDMNKLIQVLLLETDYEKIVFDIGFITDAMMVLLEKADRIFMPEARHPIQKSKQQAFERLILREHLEQIWNKTDKVPVLHRKNISEKR